MPRLRSAFIRATLAGVFRHDSLRHVHWTSASSGTVRFRRRVFDTLHNIAHPGIRATAKLISDRYVWPGMQGCPQLDTFLFSLPIVQGATTRFGPAWPFPDSHFAPRPHPHGYRWSSATFQWHDLYSYNHRSFHSMARSHRFRTSRLTPSLALLSNAG